MVRNARAPVIYNIFIPTQKKRTGFINMHDDKM